MPSTLCSAAQVLLPSQPGDAKKHSNTWEQGLWAAKVGATTVGIGALFAVTGAEVSSASPCCPETCDNRHFIGPQETCHSSPQLVALCACRASHSRSTYTIRSIDMVMQLMVPCAHS